MQKWEYFVYRTPSLRVTEELNDMGEVGWELVFVRLMPVSCFHPESYELVFKRPKGGG